MYNDVVIRAHEALKDVPIVRGVLRNMLLPSRRTVDGFLVELHPSVTYADRVILTTDGFDEAKSIAALMNVMAPDNTLFVDIGAHMGYYSLYATRALGAASDIVACEANPAIMSYLKTNLALNRVENRVMTVQAAIADTAGTAVLRLASGNAGEASLRDLGLRGGEVEVPTIPLADIVQKHRNGRELVIKIDVEGFEDAVLGPFLQNADRADLPRHILLEVTYQGVWDTDILALIESKGYAVVFDDEGNRIYSLPKED